MSRLEKLRKKHGLTAPVDAPTTRLDKMRSQYTVADNAGEVLSKAYTQGSGVFRAPETFTPKSTSIGVPSRPENKPGAPGSTMPNFRTPNSNAGGSKQALSGPAELPIDNTAAGIKAKYETTAADYEKRMSYLNDLFWEAKDWEDGVAGLPADQRPTKTWDEFDSAEAIRAEMRRLEAERGAQANQYYAVENTEKLEQLAKDQTAKGHAVTAKQADEDADKVLLVLKVIMGQGETPYEEYEAAVSYLKKTYGVTDEAIRAARAREYTPREDGYDNLWQLYDELVEKSKGAKEALDNEGYDYERLSGYVERVNAAEEADARIQQLQEEILGAKNGWGVVGANAVSVAATPLQAFEFFGQLLGNIGHNNAKNLDTYVPLNTDSMRVTQFKDTVRGATGERIVQSIENEFVGQAASFLYQSGMSIVDSYALAHTFGPAASVFLAGSAAASATASAMDKGATSAQALLVGTAAGVAEGFFEKYSIEKLLDLKDAKSAKEALKQVWVLRNVEGSEELFTEVANIMVDAAIMGHNSDFNKAVRQYMKENPDWTEDQARAKAYMDNIVQVGLAYAGGFIAGGVAGDFQVGAQFGMNKAQEYAVDNVMGRLATNRVDILAAAQQFAPESKTYQLAERVAKTDRNGNFEASNALWGQLVRTMGEERAQYGPRAGGTTVGDVLKSKAATAPTVERTAVNIDHTERGGTAPTNADMAALDITSDAQPAAPSTAIQPAAPSTAAQVNANPGAQQARLAELTEQNKDRAREVLNEAVESAPIAQPTQTEPVPTQAPQPAQTVPVSTQEKTEAQTTAKSGAKTMRYIGSQGANPTLKLFDGTTVTKAEYVDRYMKANPGKTEADATKVFNEALKGQTIYGQLAPAPDAMDDAAARPSAGPAMEETVPSERQTLEQYSASVVRSNKSAAAEVQKRVISDLNAAFKRTGVRVNVEGQHMGKNGVNGMWSPDGKVVLNLDRLNSQGEIYWTLSHELLHEAIYKSKDTELVNSLLAFGEDFFGTTRWNDLCAANRDAQINAHKENILETAKKDGAAMTEKTAAKKAVAIVDAPAKNGNPSFMDEENAADVLRIVLRQTDALSDYVLRNRRAVIKIRDWVQNKLSDMLTGDIAAEATKRAGVLNDIVKRLDKALTNADGKGQTERKVAKNSAGDADPGEPADSVEARYSAPQRTDTNTPEFRAWFHDDSGELTNPDGSPKELLRGSIHSGPTTFREGAANNSGGIFATTDQYAAENYAGRGAGMTPTEYKPTHYKKWGDAHLDSLTGAFGPQVSLDPEGPTWVFAIQTRNGWEVAGEYEDNAAGLARFNAEFGALMRRYGAINPGFMRFYGSAQKTLVVDAAGRNWKNADNEGSKTDDVVARAWEDGYDCVVFNNVQDGGESIGFEFDEDDNYVAVQKPIQVVVFKNSSQVKSVYNTGTWDRNNPDVRYSVGGLNSDPSGDMIDAVEARKQFVLQFTGEVIAGENIELTRREFSAIRHELKSGNGEIDPDGQAGRIHLFGYTYLFQVTRKSAVLVFDVLSEEEYRAKQEVYKEEYENERDSAERNGAALGQTRSGYADRTDDFVQGPQTGARGRNAQVAEGEPGRRPDGRGSRREGDSAGEVKFSPADDTDINPETGFEKGSLTDAIDTIRKIKNAEELVEVLEQTQRLLEELREEHNGKVRDQRAQATLRPNLRQEDIERNRKSVEKLIAKYGEMKQTSGAQQTRHIPKKIDANTKVRGAVKTIAGHSAVTDDIYNPLEQDIISGTIGTTYVPVTDNEVLDKIRKQIETKEGFAEMQKQWNDLVTEDRAPTKHDVAVGEALLIQACAEKRVDVALRLIAEISIMGTRAGQVVQAFSLLKKMTPSGRIYYLQKTVDELNNSKSLRTRGLVVKLNQTLLNKMLQAATAEEIEAAESELIKDIAKQIPATFADKLNAWRYLSMLANTRTHIRNVFGNAVFAPARFISNTIATGVEHVFLDKSDRTKSVALSDEWREFAETDAEGMKAELQGSGRYGTKDRILDARPVFGNADLARTKVGALVSKTLGKKVEQARKKNANLMEAEDWGLKIPKTSIYLPGLRSAYVKALGGYLQARGFSPADVAGADSSPEGRAALDQARAYAIQEARRATYRDMSRLAANLAHFTKNSGPLAKVLVGGLTPFVSTPINVGKRAMDYSILGLGRGLLNLGAQKVYRATSANRENGAMNVMNDWANSLARAMGGEKSSSEIISTMCDGLTGSGIMLVGYFLAKAGCLIGALGDDDEDREKELQGYQDYSLTLGDKNITISWMAPVAMPLFVGAEVYRMLEEKGLGNYDFLDAALTLFNPMFEMSMLDGINSTLSAVKYDDSENPLVPIVETIIGSYAGQLIPSAFGAVTRTVDDSRRSAFTPTGERGVKKWLDRWKQSNINGKVPFMSAERMLYVDEWGRADTEDRIWFRLFENFLSPGYINTVDNTPVDVELERLAAATGDGAVFPDKARKSFTVDKVEHRMTQDEYEEHLMYRGQLSYRMVSDLIYSVGYHSMSDEEKAVAVGFIYTFASDSAKCNTIGDWKSMSGWEADLKEIVSNGGDASEYLMLKAQAKILSDKSGKTVGIDEVAIGTDSLSALDTAQYIFYDHQLSKEVDDPYDTSDGLKYHLTDSQYAHYTNLWKNEFYPVFVEMYDSNEYKNATVAERMDMVRDAKNEAGKAARAELVYWLWDQGIESTPK